MAGGQLVLLQDRCQAGTLRGRTGLGSSDQGTACFLLRQLGAPGLQACPWNPSFPLLPVSCLALLPSFLLGFQV